MDKRQSPIEEGYWLNIGSIAIKGDRGEPGKSVSSASISSTGFITFTFTDGTSLTLNQSVKGSDGAPGRDGGTPTISATRVSNGVNIATYSPAGALTSSSIVYDGTPGQSIVGP